ncbi:hypothetical protein XAR_2881 [Xanthomonas citri pv. glycines str. 8ra]|nr:hypothetical protein XAR_2881 [Xanthomonas citri pv. glycines str. 8ra]
MLGVAQGRADGDVGGLGHAPILERVMHFEMRCVGRQRRGARSAGGQPSGSALWRTDTALRALPRRPAWAAAHALSRRATGRFVLTSTYITRSK